MKTRHGGLRGWKRRRAGKLAQMCAVAVGQAHICNRLNLLGEFLSRSATLHIFCPAESSTRDNESLDCLPLFFLSCFPLCVMNRFPHRQTNSRSGSDSRRRGILCVEDI